MYIQVINFTMLEHILNIYYCHNFYSYFAEKKEIYTTINYVCNESCTSLIIDKNLVESCRPLNCWEVFFLMDFLMKMNWVRS